LEAFDASLARFFQARIPKTWPDAARTLNRETLFRNAEELEARISEGAFLAAWGVEFSTTKLPEAQESYDRDKLGSRLREIRKGLADERDAQQAAQMRFLTESDALEKRSAKAMNDLQSKTATSVELRNKLLDEAVRLENALLTLRSHYDASRNCRRDELEKREAIWKEADAAWRQEEQEMKARFQARLGELETAFASRICKLTDEENEQRATIERDEAKSARKRDEELARIEREFQKALAEKGVDATLVDTAHKRFLDAEQKVQRISQHSGEVAEYRQKKREWMDPLDSWEFERKSMDEVLLEKSALLDQLRQRHEAVSNRFIQRLAQLADAAGAIKKDEDAVLRFRKDSRFQQEWGAFDRDDLPVASFYRAEAVCDFLTAAEGAHQQRESIGTKGDKAAKSFLRHFDSETLDRKVLGFSPIHEFFDWFVFVGNELKPFVDNRGITAMKQIQTREFEQLIRNICNKNADFREGVRKVNRTAEQVQSHLATNNFVDVLDSIELKVERVDSNLTRTLAELENFAGISFNDEQELFGKRANRADVDRAIEHFERLVREIDSYRSAQLSLADYFDFLIRVHENGHDMGWRKSLDHIGSTGTDYLVKMLIYLSLIEVYRAQAIDSKTGSTVHCVLDETGVLAPKYVRSILAYAAARGIILITAGHSQQTIGFDHWILVRKLGQRFGGQTVLRRVLKCD
jgi:hypothetical protein